MSEKKSAEIIDVCGACKSKKSSDGARRDNGINCTCCGTWYHLYCVKMSKALKKKNYFCLKCLNDSNFATEAVKLNKSLTETSSDIDELSAEKFEAVCREHIEKIWPFIGKKVHNVIQDNIKLLYERIKELEKKIESLDQGLVLQQQLQLINSRANNIVIRGIHAKVGNVDVNIVKSIADRIGFELANGDVTSVKRIGKPADNKRRDPAIILVSFRDSQLKSSFLKSFFTAIGKKVDVNMGLFIDGCTDKIYVSEHLDRGNLKIYLSARKLIRLGIISKCLLRNGLVYVKNKVNDSMILVKSISELDSLYQPEAAESENVK